MDVLRRSTAGLLYRDQFDRADGAPGADWSVLSGAAWAIAGNKLVNGGGADEKIVVAPAAMPALLEMVTQVIIRRAGPNRTVFQGALAKWDGTTGYLATIENLSAAERLMLYKFVAGVATLLSSNTTFVMEQTAYILKLWAKPGQQAAWLLSAAGAQLFHNPAADAALDAVSGRAGMRAWTSQPTTDYNEFDDNAAYRGNTLACSGLPAGYKLRAIHPVGGQTQTVVEVGGVATIDLDFRGCPLTRVEVLTGAGVIVHALTPSDGVWGGDVYAIAPEAFPPGPGISQICRFASDSIEPNTGPEAGGTEVVIRGELFAAGVAVSFGGSAATITEVLESQITCTTPAGTGTVDVVVTNPDGQSATVADGFTYLGESPWSDCPAPPETTWSQC